MLCIAKMLRAGLSVLPRSSCVSCAYACIAVIHLQFCAVQSVSGYPTGGWKPPEPGRIPLRHELGIRAVIYPERGWE